MRVKELNNKVAHISFAPSSIYPCFLATASAAEQVDASARLNFKSNIFYLIDKNIYNFE
jgi:hypothetical protein